MRPQHNPRPKNIPSAFPSIAFSLHFEGMGADPLPILTSM